MHVPHHGFADRIAAVANDGALGHRHPLAFDRNPIGALAKIIFGAMAIGDVAAGHTVRSDHALEPGADVGWDILVLPVVEGERRAGQRGQARQQGDLREPSHAILHSALFASSWRTGFFGAPRISRLRAIKPELSGGCTLKKYASLSRMRNDAVRNHDFLCAANSDFGAMLIHASVRAL